MGPRGDLGQLKPSEWEMLQTLADSFEAAWAGDNTVELDRFLPPPGAPLRPAVLLELIKTDLEIRWRRRQPVGLDYYLTRYPELGPAQALPAQLLYEEYRARHLYGDQPPLASYQARFPQQFPDLERLVRDQPVAPPKPPPAGKSSGGSSLPPQSAGRLQVGEGYQLLRRLGSGSFAEVWESKAPGGVDVAVKCLLQPIEKEEAQRELKSLELIKQLRHPFLLHTQAYWLSDGRVYIAMELADGSLRDRLKQCKEQGLPGVPPAELLGYFREAAEAIDFLHHNPIQKVVHRDIKPENVLLLQGHAKVADFGLARVLHSQRMSVSGGAGTPRYMAPEVWDSKLYKVGERSDLYSLAMTYAELRRGHHPFASKDMLGLMFAHLQDTPELAPLPEAEQKVLLKALAKRPDDRHASCTEFVRALDEAVGLGPPGRSHSSLPGAAAPADLEPPHAAGQQTPVPGVNQAWRGPRSRPRPPRRRLWPRVLFASLLLAAVAAYVWQTTWPKLTVKAPEEVTVPAGGTSTFRVSLGRRNLDGPAAVTFANVPDGVVLRAAPEPDVTDVFLVTASALPDVPPGPAAGPVTVRVAVGETAEEKQVALAVGKPAYSLPPWSKAPAAGVRHEPDGRVFYDRIVVRKGGLAVPFVFVPGFVVPDDPGRKIEPFYVMETKVPVGQYALFAKENADQLDKKDWQNDDIKPIRQEREDFPVFNVPAGDAHRFAVWLLGEGWGFLPKEEQWDKAGGRYDGRKGPYEEPWQAGQIAVGLKEPLPCGTAEKDVSYWKARDMAGNGRELTRRAKYTNDTFVPVPKGQEGNYGVVLRGRSFKDAEPFQFQSLEKDGRLGLQPYSEGSFDIGFRVVLEIRP